MKYTRPFSFNKLIHLVARQGYEKLVHVQWMDVEIIVDHLISSNQSVVVGISPKEIYKFSEIMQDESGGCVIRSLASSHGFNDVNISYDTINSMKLFEFYFSEKDHLVIAAFIEEMIETLEAFVMTSLEVMHPKRDYHLLPYTVDPDDPSVVECTDWRYLPNIARNYLQPEILDNPEPPASVNPEPPTMLGTGHDLF